MSSPRWRVHCALTVVAAVIPLVALTVLFAASAAASPSTWLVLRLAGVTLVGFPVLGVLVGTLKGPWNGRATDGTVLLQTHEWSPGRARMKLWVLVDHEDLTRDERAYDTDTYQPRPHLWERIRDPL